jgi:hypothetical protein
MFQVLDDGVYFAPDAHGFAMLEPAERSALAPPEGLGDAGGAADPERGWWRVLPFPFSPQQLLAFAEYALETDLSRWFFADPDSDKDFDSIGVDTAPRARELARFLAGGPEPAAPAESGEPVEQPAATPQREQPAERRARRLARLRELGGDMLPAGDSWHARGQRRGALAALVREEAAAGRPMSDKSDVRADLAAAMGDLRGS